MRLLCEISENFDSENTFLLVLALLLVRRVMIGN